MKETLEILKNDPHVAKMIEDGWQVNRITFGKDGEVASISYSMELPEKTKHEMQIASLIANLRRRWWPFGKKKIDRLEKLLKGE